MKLAEGKTPKGRCAIKRQISNAIYNHLKAEDARTARGLGG